ncbi:MAG TPA: (2Fe-2S)-binding protein [Tepidiformaceae bacterium]
MADGNNLFDEDPQKTSKSEKSEKTTNDQQKQGQPEGERSPWSLSRRRLIAGAGAVAATGVVVGTGATVAVEKLGGGSSNKSTPTQSNGVTYGVPSGESVTASVVRLNVNGVDQFVSVTPNQSLAEVLRENLGLTGTKTGCDRSECGACTVLVDGVPHNSCSLLAIREDGKSIITVEGLAQGTTLSTVQKAFMDNMGYQCGFCTSGQMLQATALLKSNPNPDEAAIRHALSGNLCKCGAYPNILASVQAAAKATKA